MMKLFLCISLALTCVAAKYECTPGTYFQIDCNTCFCSNDGEILACTDMACPPEGNSNIRIDSTQDHNKQKCTPGTTYNDYCNVCTCSADGLTFGCTMMYCDKNVWNNDGSIKDSALSQKRLNGKRQVCTPSARFNDYCNVCVCSDDGTAAGCTAMFCDKNVWNQDGSRKDLAFAKKSQNVCTPGATFNDYCNVCSCLPDGSNFYCTAMFCDKNVWNKDGSLKDSSTVTQKLQTVKYCEPGKTFSPDNCNTCVCNEYGTEAACTRKLCLGNFKTIYEVTNEENWGPLYKEGDACTPGKAFYSECNRCVCTEGGRSAFCTLMSCQRSP